MTDYLTPDSFAPPAQEASALTSKTLGFPYPFHLPPRKKEQPRYVDENGWPIWRVSYSLPIHLGTSGRMMALIGKPKRSWAQAWAARMGRDKGWTKIVVGKWQGGLDFEPAAWRI